MEPSPNPGATAPKATAREWIGLAVIALPCLVYAMDLTVLNLAVPAISADLQPSSAQLLWIIDIYGFFVAGCLITMGTLGDRIGRRKLLLAGAAAFGIASTFAAFADTAGELILWRALLGIAGATLAPSTMSLIRNMFADDRERQFAIGVWIASFSVGGVIGPLVGGVVLEYFSWGAVFLVAVPVMVLLLVLGPILLPEYRDPNAGRIDVASALLSLVAVLAMIYGLKRVAEQGVDAVGLAVGAAGLALGVLFVARQRRLAYPFVDLALFRLPRFNAAIAAYALSCLAMFGVYIFVAQYLQLVLGLGALQAGLATIPWALAFVVGSLTTPLVARRFAPITVIAYGLAVAALGFLILVLAGEDYGLAALVVGTIVMSLGLAPVFTLGNEIIITAAPPERAGAASALSETSSEFSGALGIALFGTIGTLLYRASLGRALPADLPPEIRDQALATLGGALTAANALPAATGTALADSARLAFAGALQWASFVAALVLVGACVLCVRLLRSPKPAPATTS